MKKVDIILPLIVFFVTLSIGAISLKVLPNFPVISDCKLYDEVAINLAQGKGFTSEGIPNSEAPPGYPFFLAAIYKIFGHNYKAVKIIQFLLLAILAIVVYFIGKDFLNLSPFYSFSAALLVGAWPYFIFHALLIATEILFIFFLILSIYFLLKLRKNPSPKNALIAGGLLGITSLIRPVVMLIPFWLIFSFFVLSKIRKMDKEYLFKLRWVIFFFLCVISIWIIRNYIEFHQFIPIASGLIGPTLEKAFITVNYTQGSEALNPGEANWKITVISRLKNIYLFWNPGAQGDYAQKIISTFPIMTTLVSIYKIFFITIVIFAFYSLKNFWKNKYVSLFWIVIFYFWAFHTILFPYPRYTLPIIPLIILLAFFTLQNIISRLNLRGEEKTH